MLLLSISLFSVNFYISILSSDTLGQMEPNLTGSIYQRSFTKSHLDGITNMDATGNPSVWLADQNKFFSWNHKAKWNHLFEVFNKVFSFLPDWTTNMAARGNSCFCLAVLKKNQRPIFAKWNNIWKKAIMQEFLWSFLISYWFKLNEVIINVSWFW